MNNKNRILTAILIVLILLTGFVMLNTLNRCSSLKKHKTETCNKQFAEHCRQKKLGFDKAQTEVYECAYKAFQPKIDSVMKKLEMLKRESFVELKKENVDMQRLDSLSNAIGAQHVYIKNTINGLYIELKATCNPDQLEDLEDVFMPLFNRKHHTREKSFRNPDENKCLKKNMDQKASKKSEQGKDCDKKPQKPNNDKRK